MNLCWTNPKLQFSAQTALTLKNQNWFGCNVAWFRCCCNVFTFLCEAVFNMTKTDCSWFKSEEHRHHASKKPHMRRGQALHVSTHINCDELIQHTIPEIVQANTENQTQSNVACHNFFLHCVTHGSTTLAFSHESFVCGPTMGTRNRRSGFMCVSVARSNSCAHPELFAQTSEFLWTVVMTVMRMFFVHLFRLSFFPFGTCAIASFVTTYDWWCVGNIQSRIWNLDKWLPKISRKLYGTCITIGFKVGLL